MPRKPPVRKLDIRGQIPTKRLPDNPDPGIRWDGPPYERSKGRWSGTVDFGGTKHHVGTFDTPRQWGEARDAKLVALRAARDAPSTPSTPLEGLTIAQFVGEPGERWPWDFNPNGRRRRPQTMRHHEQCIKPLLRAFGDRLLKGGLSVSEARLWGNGATENQLTSAIAMFNDARTDDGSVLNPFQGLSRKRTRGRSDLPHVLSVEEVELLKQVSRRVHAGLYAPVMEAMIEVMATSAPRPGELFALERSEFRPELGEYHIWQAVKKGSRLGPPKYDQVRDIVLAPSGVEALLRVPGLHDRWLLPSKTGRLMSQSNWTTYWHPVREAFTALLPDSHWLVRRIARCAEALAQEPDEEERSRMDDGKFDLYELRHRAITYMVTPRPDGLGMHHSDVADQVGHQDGGRLIERVYIHRNPEQRRARMRAAYGYESGEAA